MIKYLQIVFLFFLLSYCANKQPVQIPQGIRGKIIWLEGNMMPSIGSDIPDKSKGTPIQRQIYIYALTNRDQTEIWVLLIPPNSTALSSGVKILTLISLDLR